MIRGRKPVPTALRELRGNPGKRPGNPDEPQIEASLPDAPAFLKGPALERWTAIAPTLAQMGILTAIDTDALAAYCQVWSRWKEAEMKVQELGQLVKTTNGNLIQSPYVGIANRALSHVRAYEAEFGMTPSSRSRVKVAKAKTSFSRSAADRQRERFFGVPGGRS